MAFIGNQPFTAAFLTDTFSGTGSQTAYTMTVAPANTSSIIVAVTGVLQDPSTYSVSGTTLTFSAAPPSGTSNISVRYLGIPASGVTTTAYRTVTDFTATAAQTSFSVPSYTVGYIDVYRNGVRLVSTDFTATTGTTVVLANACTVGDAVVTESFLVSSVLNAIPATAGAISLTSATYLSGTLPVANGGTGLTTVPHTVQVFTSGSGTYTTPTNVKAIWVRAIGGGGGGAGNGTSAAIGTGGGSTTFGAFTAGGGQPGGPNSGNTVAGGTVSGSPTVSIAGGRGGGSATGTSGQYGPGNMGGSGAFGGAGAGGQGTQAADPAVANSGGGGGGAGTNPSAGANVSGGGGGSGGYFENYYSSPAATYSYGVGAGGTAGTAGTSGYAGGAGGSGIIIVQEYYV